MIIDGWQNVTSWYEAVREICGGEGREACLCTIQTNLLSLFLK